MIIKNINEYFTDIYFYLHPSQQEIISHQSVRILQLIQKQQHVTIQDVAQHLHISHNTASEHVKKLEKSKWVQKERSQEDQRKVYLSLTVDGWIMLRANTELDERKLTNALAKLSEEDQQKVLEGFRLLSEVVK
ncbi:MarR family winged helix-turn-helix transcriptional regulator [Psychrobacillus sp.]|uniref:MarR family winged helix-turn-helix transcriptional regulator n=1 Tax=Psychrobacillus sp. TaxID=1871623 RepID=UPI0028BDCBC9|nr:MarR family winged helix-turn-helix transcriptional regulator [Psychrobacillus sp.]